MKPLVSVVIPCRNEVKSIRATVEALLKSNHPNVEILVIDGMSEDGTREVLHKLGEEDARVRMIDNPQRLTPYAFNLGVVNSRGEYVQIVGSRNVLDPDYIPILVETLELRPEVGCVGGDYQHVYDSSSGRFVSLAMESKFGVGMGNYRTMAQDAYVDTVGIPLYRQSIFTEVGLFDERLTRNQDDDFNFRVRQKGYKILYVHRAKATYLVRASLKKTFRQYFQYGYFKVFVNRKHKAVTSVRQMVPAAFVAFLTIAVPLSLVEPHVRMLLAAVLAAYFVLGMVLAGRALGLADRARVLGCCFVLHCGYALGYWQGIWDFLLIHRAPRETLQRQTT